MDIFEAINKRRSIRSFTGEPVPDKEIEKILNAAIMAPSAGNMQPWNFIVIKNADIKKKLAEAAYHQNFLITCSVVIAVCANTENEIRYKHRGMELYRIQDTAAAIQNMLLAIYALGYGAVWVGAFDEEEVGMILEVPEKVRPVALIPIGKPDIELKPEEIPSRKPLEKVTFYDKFGNR